MNNTNFENTNPEQAAKPLSSEERLERAVFAFDNLPNSILRIRQARRLDPNSPDYDRNLAWDFYLNRK